MKKSIAALALVAAVAPALAAAANHNEHAAHGAMPAAAPQAVLADGLVKKVDKSGGKLTIAHDALPNGMPAMTMAFKVKEVAWLDKVKAGQKIRFAVDSIDGALTVVRLELQK